jgi:hypothetical protein
MYITQGTYGSVSPSGDVSFAHGQRIYIYNLRPFRITFYRVVFIVGSKYLVANNNLRAYGFPISAWIIPDVHSSLVLHDC